jgi:signal peptidase I
MKLNLSDAPITAELLAASLARTGSALIAVNGNSMYPTLQMGWRVYLKPARGDDLKVGDIAVFRGEHYLTIHRLVWRERDASGERLVFRGDYNRVRERIDPGAVLARVVAVEVPGRKKGLERVIAVEPDALTLFYRACHAAYRLMRPILPAPPPRDRPPGPLGRAARALFAAIEKMLSLLLPQRGV